MSVTTAAGAAGQIRPVHQNINSIYVDAEIVGAGRAFVADSRPMGGRRRPPLNGEPPLSGHRPDSPSTTRPGGAAAPGVTRCGRWVGRRSQTFTLVSRWQKCSVDFVGGRRVLEAGASAGQAGARSRILPPVDFQSSARCGHFPRPHSRRVQHPIAAGQPGPVGLGRTQPGLIPSEGLPPLRCHHFDAIATSIPEKLSRLTCSKASLRPWSIGPIRPDSAVRCHSDTAAPSFLGCCSIRSPATA